MFKGNYNKYYKSLVKIRSFCLYCTPKARYFSYFHFYYMKSLRFSSTKSHQEIRNYLNNYRIPLRRLSLFCCKGYINYPRYFISFYIVNANLIVSLSIRVSKAASLLSQKERQKGIFYLEKRAYPP